VKWIYLLLFGLVLSLSSYTTASTANKPISIVIVPVTSEDTFIPVTGPMNLTQAGATYKVMQDIICDQTCFGLMASGVTLDINGHVIIYGVANTTNRRHAIVGIRCGEIQQDGNPCYNNTAPTNITIIDSVGTGLIRQGGGGSYSYVIALKNVDYTTIKNVKIEYNGDSAKCIWGSYTGGVLVDGVNCANTNPQPTIKNRHQLDGAQIGFHEGKDEAASIVQNSTLSGSPQGGILLTSRGSKALNNNIRMNTYYTNSSGVYLWGADQEAAFNQIDTTQGTDSGRGMQTYYGNGAKIHDNVIRVRELPQNAEYNGCVIGGAYGIQFENTMNAESWNNKITAIAGACDGTAIRASAGSPTVKGSVVSFNETLVAIRASATSAGKGKCLTTREANGYTLRDSTAVCGSYNVEDKTTTPTPTNAEITNVTFIKDTVYPSTDFRTWRPVGFAAPMNYVCTGCVFNGMSPTSVSALVIGTYQAKYTIKINSQYTITNSATQAVIITQP
jgi:hypothetical protein